MTQDNRPSFDAESGVAEDAKGFESLLDYLSKQRGFDFSAYKSASLSRRIRRRMEVVAVASYSEYLDYLEVHPDEFLQLFNTILINVTGFFRDASTWSALRLQIHRIANAKGREVPIRVWSAGCASGEEAYSLAMLFGEVLGLSALSQRVKIYATDVDDEALSQARAAVYSAKSVEAIAPDLLEKYFTKVGDSYLFNREARRAVIFGRHDLVQDAPISRVEILTCRNTLMYFNSETQTRILNRLHFALANDGVLALGKAEMLLTHGGLFTPIDLKLRLFMRAGGGIRARERVAHTAEAIHPTDDGHNDWTRLHGAAFESSPLAQVLLDVTGRVVLVSKKASALWPITKNDIGRSFQELELSHEPTELRPIIDQVKTELRPVRMKEIERIQPSGEKTYVATEIAPIAEGGNVLGVQITFADSTETQLLQTELDKANQELATSHQELQSTSEELETTNEELQSTVEELETTNEELQSTNEELETINEELQSANEELLTMNGELQRRGEDLSHANLFLGTILSGLRCGVAVLDGDLIVKAWSDKMVDLWGLRQEEAAGSHLFNLDIGLPMESLRSEIRACLNAQSDGASKDHPEPSEPEREQTVECTNRRGKPIKCRINIRALQNEGGRGVILIVEEV